MNPNNSILVYKMAWATCGLMAFPIALTASIAARAQETNVVSTNIVVIPAIPVTTTDSANTWALINAMVEQIVNSPASLLVIIGLSIIAYVIEVIASLPSKAILPFCTFGGAVSYWVFATTSSVPPYFPYPFAVLVVNGLVCGFVAYVFHTTVVKWFMNKFQPGKLEQKKEVKPPPNQ